MEYLQQEQPLFCETSVLLFSSCSCSFGSTNKAVIAHNVSRTNTSGWCMTSPSEIMSPQPPETGTNVRTSSATSMTYGPIFQVVRCILCSLILRASIFSQQRTLVCSHPRAEHGRIRLASPPGKKNNLVTIVRTEYEISV